MNTEFADKIGQELGVSSWIVMDQARIDAFADVTNDHQFLHVDPERAKETEFNGTIAHGFLTVSMLTSMAYEVLPKLHEQKMLVNYGMDRLRFVSPVPAGARIRGRFVLAKVDTSSPNEITLTHDVTVEIEDREKPAIVASWIGRHYFE